MNDSARATPAAPVPPVSLGVALSFGLYGLVRRVAKVEALPGLTGETLLLLPFAAGYILWTEFAGYGAMSGMGLGMRGKDVLTASA